MQRKVNSKFVFMGRTSIFLLRVIDVGIDSTCDGCHFFSGSYCQADGIRDLVGGCYNNNVPASLTYRSDTNVIFKLIKSKLCKDL